MRIRIVGAVAVLVAALVHLYLYFSVFHSEPVVGPAFLLNVVGGVVIAVLLVRWRTSWIPGFLAAGFGVSTLGSFIIAATVGLFGVHEHWVGWSVWTAAASEVVAIVAGVLVMMDALPDRAGGRMPHVPHFRGAHQP
jgi:hypothetical protein